MSSKGETSMSSKGETSLESVGMVEITSASNLVWFGNNNHPVQAGGDNRDEHKKGRWLPFRTNTAHCLVADGDRAGFGLLVTNLACTSSTASRT